MGERTDLGDAELVVRTRAGDPEAYGELVSRYQRSAYALAFGVTRRHEDAEDAAQESFVVALERLDECRNPEKFGGWLLAIVRNRSRNLVRRETLRAGEALPASLASARPGPDRDTERGELRERLTEALAELTEVQREVVLLHDLEGWKHREIAGVLEMPPGTVRSHLHYARKKLRAALGGSPESEPDEGEDE
ncbi:MAG: sigma-70 family RNA polymerase sigma factor [Gemmatimonadota bacterium]